MRSIQTTYYRFRRPVRVNRSIHLDSAAMRCFDYMHRNTYEATSAEVHDLETGELYLSVYLTPEGNLFSFYGPGASSATARHEKIMRKAEDEVDKE